MSKPAPNESFSPTAATLIALLISLAATLALAGPAQALSQKISFEVENVNESAVGGPADGGTYTLRGMLVGSERDLVGENKVDAATLYLHGLSYGQFYWHLKGAARFDYARKMAQKGHVSFVINRLGYRRSGKPDGSQTSWGSQATIANQILDQIRDGSYTVRKGGKKIGTTQAPSFDRLALAGHSAGGFIAELAAYSFGNADALMVLGASDVFFSDLALTSAAETTALCTGQDYAFYGQTEADFQSAHFHNSTQKVIDKITDRRTMDPCGETASFPTVLPTNALSVGSLDIPVFLAYGADDALFPPPAETLQSGVYTGVDDFTSMTVPNMGHAMLVERSGIGLRREISDWLAERGF